VPVPISSPTAGRFPGLVDGMVFACLLSLPVWIVLGYWLLTY